MFYSRAPRRPLILRSTPRCTVDVCTNLWQALAMETTWLDRLLSNGFHGFPLALALNPSGFRHPHGRPPPSKAGQKKARPVMFHMMPSHCDVLAYRAILSQEAQWNLLWLEALSHETGQVAAHGAPTRRFKPVFFCFLALWCWGCFNKNLACM